MFLIKFIPRFPELPLHILPAPPLLLLLFLRILQLHLPQLPQILDLLLRRTIPKITLPIIHHKNPLMIDIGMVDGFVHIQQEHLRRVCLRDEPFLGEV